MIIGGLQKLTLIDYPGKIACTVFTVGCNFRCPFCHNPELIDRVKFKLAEIIEEKDFFSFLESRRGLLDGVCVTGGEPTLQPDLPEFIKKIKGLGFFVKLDTNGTNPEMLEKLIGDELVNYVAMDIKAPIQVSSFPDFIEDLPILSRTRDKVGARWQSHRDKFSAKGGSALGGQVSSLYKNVTGVSVDLEKIEKSAKIIMDSGVDYEFRTTIVPGLHTEEDITNIAEFIRGAKKYYLQQFRPGEKILGEECRAVKPYPAEFIEKIKDKIKEFFEVCEIRE